MEVGELIACSELQKITQSLSNVTLKHGVKFETIERITNTAKCEKNKTDDQDVNLLTDCVRVLRNLVAGIPQNQQIVSELLNSTYDIWDIIFRCLDEIEGGNQCYLPLLRCTIQLVGNLSVGRTHFQAENLWKITSASEQIFLRSSDLRSKNYICMVLLNVIQNEELFDILETSGELGGSSEEIARQITNFHSIWRNLVDSQLDGAGCEFSLFCLEAVVCSENFFVFLDLSSRLSLLDIIVDVVEKTDVRISTENLLVLSEDFQKQSDVILTTNYGSVDQLNPRNVSNLLLILATASSSEKHREKLQDVTSLLLNALYLLKMVHMAGKEGGSSHTPISKMSELDNIKQNGDVEDNPTYGFKANLIRLIANLCWNHQKNKSLVGELEGVALILDCSALDGRNPLITQWVVLAVKALLSDHPDNQAVLIALRREGAADHALLRELGIDFSPDGKIKTAQKTE